MPVEIFDELLHAAVVMQLGFQRLGGAFIAQENADTGIQERQFA